jgi:hypothetical protein
LPQAVSTKGVASGDGKEKHVSVSPGKIEARLFLPEATHRYLKANCGSRGMGEYVHDIVLAYQKQTALDAKLERIERYVLELLDRK